MLYWKDLEDNMDLFKNKVDNIVFYLTVFLFGINFFKAGTYIMLFSFAGIFFHLLYNRKIEFRKKDLIIMALIVLFAASYDIIEYINFKETSILRFVYHVALPTECYFVITNLLNNVANKKTFIENTLFCIAASFLFHGVLNYLLEAINGFTNLKAVNMRKIMDVWEGVALSATIENSKLVFSIALLPWLLFSTSKMKRVISFIFILVGAFIAMEIGSRSYFLTFAVAIIGLLILTYIKEYYSKEKMRKFLLLLLLIFAVAAIFVWIFFSDSFLVQRLQSMSLNIFDDPRIETWKIVIGSAPSNLLGAKAAPIGLSYAHNLWIDILYYVGVIPFFLLLCISWSFIKNLILEVIKKCKLTMCDLFVFCFVISLFVLCLFEPIMQGYYPIFIVFIIVLGILNNYSDKASKNSIEKGVNL